MKRIIKRILVTVIVIMYFLSIFSVGMYEEDMITFEECMHDLVIQTVFGLINYIMYIMLRRISRRIYFI